VAAKVHLLEQTRPSVSDYDGFGSNVLGAICYAVIRVGVRLDRVLVFDL